MARSKITNGSALLPNTDLRTRWARRFHDLICLHTQSLGGGDMVTEGEAFLIRRCAALNVELERMETTWAQAGASTLPELESYQRASNSLRRLLLALGLKRRAKDVTPGLGRLLLDNPP